MWVFLPLAHRVGYLTLWHIVTEHCFATRTISHAMADEPRPWSAQGGQGYRTRVISDMIARNYDESFAVALIDATRGGPNNLYRVIRAALCTLLKVDSDALTLSAIASHPVDLLPVLEDGSRGGVVKYAIRPLVHVVTHADFDVGITEYVTALTDAVPWPVDENQVRIAGAPKEWGPVKPSVLNSTAATVGDFQREARLVLMQAHSSSHQRLALAIKSYFREIAAIALASATAEKTAKEERAKDDKSTPAWTDHKMEALLQKAEATYGLIIFRSALNSALGCTRLFDYLKKDALPPSKACGPDAQMPYSDESGSILSYKQLQRQVQVDGSQAMETEAEVLEGTSGRVRARDPRTHTEAFANSRRWWYSILVAQQELPAALVQPLSVIAYLDMLWYVSTYRGVSFTKFMTLREESRAAITAAIAAGATFDEALLKARTTLEQDLVDHRKHGADTLAPSTLSSPSSALSASTSGSPQAQCPKCPQLKAEIRELQSSLANRNSTISALGGSTRKVHRSDTDRGGGGGGGSGSGGGGGGGGGNYRRGGGNAAGGRGNGRGRGRGGGGGSTGDSGRSSHEGGGDAPSGGRVAALQGESVQETRLPDASRISYIS